ncbi:MAG: LamG domain-containing protein, partial [Phycisphaeraceae bacterium]|nr:LamG domain-containing protein [Phycisphaeraceae bacterium]
SLPFYYDNTGGVASHIDRHWSTSQDWSAHRIQTLVLYFYADAANTGQLYVKINDIKIPYDGDPSNLTKARWNPWHVDLSSLSVSSVTTLSIGVDGAGASGMVLLDDIGLYRSAPAMVTPVPPSIEGLVAHWALDDGAGTTAFDSAGTNHGTVNGLALWTTGQLGGALELDGAGAYVDCGSPATLDITDVITLAAWVNPLDAGNGEHNPYIAKGDHAYTLKHGAGNAFEFLLYQGAWNYIQVPVTSAFNDNWYHLAGTYDGAQLKLYVNGVLGATMASSGGIDSSTDAVELGRNSEYPDRLFGGSIDDARIYNRVLSEAEILYLSNQ